MPYTPLYNEQGTVVLAIAEQVKRAHPQDWADAHNGDPESGSRYIRRVAWEVARVYPQLRCGLNGKRGNVHDLSQDVLAFPNPSGAPDASHTFAGLEIRDIIGRAGAPDAYLTWGDVTQATLDKGEAGAWVEPEPVDDAEPEPEPEPEPDPVTPYPGDPTWDAVGEILFADYKEAGQAPNPGMGRWFGRTIWDATEGDQHGVVLTVDASIAKHRKEWRVALGLPPV